VHVREFVKREAFTQSETKSTGVIIIIILNNNS